MTSRPIHYITNAEIKPAIFRSKLSYCSNMRDSNNRLYVEPDIMMESIDDTTWTKWVSTIKRNGDATVQRKLATEKANFSKLPDGTTIMTHSDDYIPEGEKLPFKPFQIWEVKDGEPVEVSRSFWKNGEFNKDHGKLTERLGEQILLMVDRVARQSNWCGYSYIDEMKDHAVLMLVRYILKFDSRKTENPFAFAQTNIYYAFVRYMQNEKKREERRLAMADDAMIYQRYFPV